MKNPEPGYKTSTTDAEDVCARALELQLVIESDLVLLPRAFETASSPAELAHEQDAATLKKLLIEAGLDARQLEPAQSRFPSAVQKSNDWIAPVIYIGSMLLSQKPAALDIALEVIKSYVVDFVSSHLSSNKVQLTFIVETSKGKKYKKLTYDGPASKIRDISQLVREIHGD